MALWIKCLNDPDIVLRRYCCPECDNYSLHIKHETFGECENGCFITNQEEIDKLIDDKKFEGLFTEDELKYNFI